jgi:hypothetical protein
MARARRVLGELDRVDDVALAEGRLRLGEEAGRRLAVAGRLSVEKAVEDAHAGQRLPETRVQHTGLATVRSRLRSGGQKGGEA